MMDTIAHHPAIRRIAYMLLGVLLLGICLRPVFGQDARDPVVASGPVLVLRATTGNEGHRVPARRAPGRAGAAPQAFQPATINVAYNGFSAQAQTAFAY